MLIKHLLTKEISESTYQYIYFHSLWGCLSKNRIWTANSPRFQCCTKRMPQPMTLTATAGKRAATYNQTLQLNTEILSQLNIDHIFYAIIKPLEGIVIPSLSSWRAPTAREECAAVITHTTAHNGFRQMIAHLSPPSRSKEPLNTVGGRAPLLQSANLGNGYRHWRLRKQLPPDALHGFTHELTFWMLSLHYCFQNKLSYFYPDIRPRWP